MKNEKTVKMKFPGYNKSLHLSFSNSHIYRLQRRLRIFKAINKYLVKVFVNLENKKMAVEINATVFIVVGNNGKQRKTPDNSRFSIVHNQACQVNISATR